jgi:hypothetical protein
MLLREWTLLENHMPRERVLLAIFLAALLGLSNSTVFASSSKEFPPLTDTQNYVNHLLSDYNALVEYSYENEPSFANVMTFFLLYPPADMTFNVIVMLAGPDDNSTVDMMFVSTDGGQPNVVYDPNDYLYNITSPGISGAGLYTNVNLSASYDSADNLLFNYNGTLTHAVVAVGVNSSDITGNYSATSENEAQWLYNNEDSFAQSWLAAHQPPTQTTTTTATYLLQSQCQGVSLCQLTENPILIILVVVFGGIVPSFFYFSGLGKFIVKHLRDEPKDTKKER